MTWARQYSDYPNAETFSHMSGDVTKEYYNEGIYEQMLELFPYLLDEEKLLPEGYLLWCQASEKYPFCLWQGDMTVTSKRRSYNTVTEPDYRFFRTNEIPDRINKTEVILRMLFSFICPLHFMLLPKTIALFQESYPNISINLTEGSNGELHQKLLKGTIDLAIAEFPENLPGISLIDFYTEKNVLVIEKGLFAKYFTIDAKECKTRLLAGDYSALSVCPFVLGDIDDIDGRIGRDILKRAGIDNPIVTATSHNVGMLLRLSLCGVGACVCSQIIVQNMLTPQQADSIWIFELGEEAASRIRFGCQIQSYQWSVIEKFIACAKAIVC